jgi:hypothetical protein
LPTCSPACLMHPESNSGGDKSVIHFYSNCNAYYM